MMARSLLNCRFACGVLAANGFENRINPNPESGFVVAGRELRLHLILRDVECRHVRQRALQAVANLNNHFAIFDKHEQNHAAAFVFLPDAPRLGNALGVGRDLVVALHFLKNCDHDLV